MLLVAQIKGGIAVTEGQNPLTISLTFATEADLDTFLRSLGKARMSDAEFCAKYMTDHGMNPDGTKIGKNVAAVEELE